MTERRPAYRCDGNKATKPAAEYSNSISGPELTRQILDLLNRTGWTYKHFGSNVRMPTGSKGWVDIWACKFDCSLIIQVKGRGDYLKPEQIKFENDIAPHLGQHLKYVRARCVEDVADAIGA
jgi:hypothetical protein